MSASLYDQLRDGIMSGRFDPGEQLVEATIASRFGTSRTPVREALRRLEQDGLVERGSRGLQVSHRSPDEILEIYEVRIILEAAAARAAAERRTSLDLIRLEQVHEAMLDAGDGSPTARAGSNRKFHELIWQISHNSTLIDILNRLNVHLVRYSETTLGYKDRWSQALHEHGELVEAIRAGDGDAAAAIAERHMIGARNTRLKMYAEETP